MLITDLVAYSRKYAARAWKKKPGQAWNAVHSKAGGDYTTQNSRTLPMILQSRKTQETRHNLAQLIKTHKWVQVKESIVSKTQNVHFH